MIDRKGLLNDLKKLVTKVEKDLRQRCEENADIDARVRIEYEKAKEAKRTALSYQPQWRDEWITQVAVAWVLGVVFVRFIEDNELIAAPFIAGPGERLPFAKEQRTAFFQQNPTLSDREYLEHVFHDVAKLPAMKELYDERHNPLWALGVSGDGAKLILEQFQKIDPGTGSLVHDFTDPEWNTRFLGDLYQDLSEAARKKYALLQTPEFVEEFILDRTLDPAIAEFGLETVRMIDPTCGSGHFLLGAFARLFRLWEAREPATVRTVLAQRVLDAIHGVDLNPYAVAISHFRLLVAALRGCGVKRLSDAPELSINLGAGDALLHGTPGRGGSSQSGWSFSPLGHAYVSENRERLQRLLDSGRYHAVVGNPPYINVRDAALSAAYRTRFRSCYKRYSLVAPFVERFFSLALSGGPTPAGYVGMIVGNAFAKRDFGKKLVEHFIPEVDLTHVLDASNAQIPGHGTPTFLMFGRNQPPVSSTVRVLIALAGETLPPADPSLGAVWRSIVQLVDHPGTKNDYIESVSMERSVLHAHPWPIASGSAADLKLQMDEECEKTLTSVIELAGIFGMTNADEAFVAPREVLVDHGVEDRYLRDFIIGDRIRDWVVYPGDAVVFPYRGMEVAPIVDATGMLRWLWPLRTVLGNRATFSKRTYFAEGRPWWTWHQVSLERLQFNLTVAYPFVASHNHFVLDHGGAVFNRTAPIVKLDPSATVDDHRGLIGFLNSSLACFWLKQVCYPKNAAINDISLEKGKPEALGYEFASGCVAKLPVPDYRRSQLFQRLANALEMLGRSVGDLEAAQWLDENTFISRAEVERVVGEAERLFEHRHARMVALQEELDWETYFIFGLVPEGGLTEVLSNEAIKIAPSDRPFAWLNDSPPDLPSEVREIFRRRKAWTAEADLAIVETRSYKRLWAGKQGVFGRHSGSSYRDRARTAIRRRLLGLLATHASQRHIISVAELASESRSLPGFESLAAWTEGSEAFDQGKVISTLAKSSAVPALPADRYRETGLRKRAAWEAIWEMQRREDRQRVPGTLAAGSSRAYAAADFKSSVYWSLRGKLDVPKERFISFPGCERESDPSLPILWAGYDHLQQAKAIAAYYQELKDNEAAAPAKLGKLLACILELLPWLKQWHNEVDPEYGTRMGDFFESFMHAEMAGLGLTMDDLREIRGL